MRNIIVTSALPYANGQIHLGHLVETIQCDIWVRFQRMRDSNIYYVCADDAHGTPIMLKAKAEGVSPEELIAQVKKDHEADFATFNISFDNFYTTHSEENRELSEYFFNQAKNHNAIDERDIEQAYDEEAGMFLPDRFVKGTCPVCEFEDQYGDSCENCGSTYTPLELINPRSVITGNEPVRRTSGHYFFKLGLYEEIIKEWQQQSNLQESAKNKLKEWFEAGLNDWDISRDAPYFGFTIPGETDKYFYVWLDAPVGYMASAKNLAERNNLDFDAWFKQDSDWELYHFIGKDILYFHALFWPAMLHAAGFRKPTGVFAHGFLTVNGAKMSKSRGTALTARAYAKHLDPDYLRYYFATKLNQHIEDIDLSFDDFVRRVNSDLVGKVVNIASRTAKLIEKRCDNQLASKLDDENAFEQFSLGVDRVAEYIEQRAFSKAVRQIMAMADTANQYIADKEPWVIAKDENRNEELHLICTQAINYFHVLIGMLTPITPSLAERAAEFLNCPLSEAGYWNQLKTPLLDKKINKFKPLLQRIETSKIEAMIEDAKEPELQDDAPTHNPNIDSIASEIEFNDFAKIDLRVAKIIDAQLVKGADKLLALTLDVGIGERSVFSGIRSHYNPEELIGKNTVLVANLKPRKMRFGVSEGMVLCAADDDNLFILEANIKAEPGTKIS